MPFRRSYGIPKKLWHSEEAMAFRRSHGVPKEATAFRRRVSVSCFYPRRLKKRRAARISGRLRDAAVVRRAGKPHSGRRAKRVPRKVCPPTKLRPSALACRRARYARRPTFSEGLSTAQGISAARNVFARRVCSLPRHNPRSRRWTAKAAVCPVPFAAPTRRSGIEARRRGASFSFPAVRAAVRLSENPFSLNVAVPAERLA